MIDIIGFIFISLYCYYNNESMASMFGCKINKFYHKYTNYTKNTDDKIWKFIYYITFKPVGNRPIFLKIGIFITFIGLLLN